MFVGKDSEMVVAERVTPHPEAVLYLVMHPQLTSVCGAFT